MCVCVREQKQKIQKKQLITFTHIHTKSYDRFHGWSSAIITTCNSCECFSSYLYINHNSNHFVRMIYTICACPFRKRYSRTHHQDTDTSNVITSTINWTFSHLFVILSLSYNRYHKTVITFCYRLLISSRSAFSISINSSIPDSIISLTSLFSFFFFLIPFLIVESIVSVYCGDSKKKREKRHEKRMWTCRFLFDARFVRFVSHHILFASNGVLPIYTRTHMSRFHALLLE